jgi:hypothetical protein
MAWYGMAMDCADVDESNRNRPYGAAEGERFTRQHRVLRRTEPPTLSMRPFIGG